MMPIYEAILEAFESMMEFCSSVVSELFNRK